MESETLSDGDIVRAELDAAFADLPVDLYMVVELSLTKPTKVLQGNNLARIIESLLVEHDRRISNLRTKLQAAAILQNVALHSPFYRRIIRAAVQRITTWFDTPIFIEPKYDPTPFEPEKDDNLIREVLTLFSICWRSDPSVVGFLLKEQEYSVQSRKVTIIRHYAAKQFQAVVRGFVHRIRHRRMLEAEKEKQLNEIRQWSVLNIQKVARGFLARKSFVRSYRIRKMLSKEVLRVAEKYLQSGDLWGFLKEINDELSRANDELHENEQRESEWATQFIEKVIVTRQNQFDKAWDNFPKALANFNRKPVSVATLLDTSPSSSTSALAGSSSIHTGAGNALANKNKTTDQQRNTSLTLLPNTRNKTQSGQSGSYLIANSPDNRSQGHPHQLLLQKGASSAAGFGQHETGRALSPKAEAGFLAIENGDISTENGLVPVLEDDTSQLSLEQSLESQGHGRTSPTARAPFRSTLPYSASAHSLLSTQSGGLNKHVADGSRTGSPPMDVLNPYSSAEVGASQPAVSQRPAAKERTVVVAQAAGRGKERGKIRNSISSSGVSVSVSTAGNSIESPTAGFGGTAGYSLASTAGASTVGVSGFTGVTHEVHNIPGPMARKALRSTVDAEVKKELHRLISNDKRSRQLTQGIVEVYGPNSDPKKLFGSKSQSNATSRAAGIGGKSQKKLKPVVDMTQKFKKKRKRRNLDGTFVEPKGKIEASHSGSWVACHSLSMSSLDDDTVGGVSVDNDTLRSLASDGSGSIKNRSSSSSGQRRASGGTNSCTALTNAHLQPGNSLLLDIPHGIEDSLERLLHAAALRCFVPDFFQGVPVSSYSNDQLDSGGEEGAGSGEEASTRGKMRKRGTFASSNVNANADYAYQMYLSMPMGLAKMKYELECKKFSQGPINRLRLKGLNFIHEVVPKSKMVMCLKNVDTPMVLINKVVELFIELKKMAAAPEGGTHIPAMQQYQYPEAGALTEGKLIQQQQQPQQKLQGEGKGSSNPADRIEGNNNSNSNSSSLDRSPRRSPQSYSSSDAAAARGRSPVSIMRGGDGTSSQRRNHTPQQQSVNFSPCTSRPCTGPGASYSDGLGVDGGLGGCAADGARRSDASVEYAAENETTDDSGGDALLDESEFKRESAEAKKANREKAELPSKLLLSMVENEGAWCKMSSTVEDIFLHAAYLVVPHTRKVLFEDPNKPSKKKRYRDVCSKMGNIAFKEHTKDMLNLENEEDKREMVKERFRSALILCTPYCIHLKQRGIFTVSDLLKVRIREALPSIEQELETQLEALLTIVVGKAVNSKVLPTIRDHLSTAENMFMVPMLYDPKFQRSPFDPFGKPPRLVDSTFRIHPSSSKSSIASQAVGGRPSYSNQAMGISTTSPILAAAAAAAAVATTAEGVQGVGISPSSDVKGFTAHGIAGVVDEEEDEDAGEEEGDDGDESEEDSNYKNPSRAGMNPVYGGDPKLTKGAIRKDLAQPISLWQQQRQHRGHAASGQSLHRRSSLDSTNNTVTSDTDISALTSDHQWTFQPAQSHHNFRGSTPPASAADGGGKGGDGRAFSGVGDRDIGGEMDNIARISMKSTAADRLRYSQAVENKTAAIGSGRGFAHTAPQLRTFAAHASNASGALSRDPPISSEKDRLTLSVPIQRGAAVADKLRQVHTPPRSPSRGTGTAVVAIAPTGGAITEDGSHRLFSGDDSVSVLEDGGSSVGQYTSVEVSNRYHSQHQPKHHEKQRHTLSHSQSERKNRPSSVEKGQNIGKGQTDKGSGGKHNGNIGQRKGFRQSDSFNTRSSADTQIFRNTYTCTHPHCGLVFSRAYTYKVHLKSHEVFSQYHAFKRRPQLGLDSDISQGNAATEALYEQRTSLPPIVQAQLNAHNSDGGEYWY